MVIFPGKAVGGSDCLYGSGGSSGWLIQLLNKRANSPGGSRLCLMVLPMMYGGVRRKLHSGVGIIIISSLIKLGHYYSLHHPHQCSLLYSAFHDRHGLLQGNNTSNS